MHLKVKPVVRKDARKPGSSRPKKLQQKKKLISKNKTKHLFPQQHHHFSTTTTTTTTLTENDNVENKTSNSDNNNQSTTQNKKQLAAYQLPPEPIPFAIKQNPASLEFVHTPHGQWEKQFQAQSEKYKNRAEALEAFLQTQKDPFRTILQHPMGQVVLSHWIANHISLHIQHMLKSGDNIPKTRTKAGSLLIGYDVDREYALEMRRKHRHEEKKQELLDLKYQLAKQQNPDAQRSEIEITTEELHTIDEELDEEFYLEVKDLPLPNDLFLTKQQMIEKMAVYLQKKLPTTTVSKPIKQNKNNKDNSTTDQATLDAATAKEEQLLKREQTIERLPWSDHGYLHFDPSATSYQDLLDDYKAKLKAHQNWVKTCGLDPHQVIELERQYHEQIKKDFEKERAKRQAEDDLYQQLRKRQEQEGDIEKQQQEKLLIGEGEPEEIAKAKQAQKEKEEKEQQEAFDNRKFSELTTDEKLTKIANHTFVACKAAAYVTYHFFRITTSMFFPQEAKKLIRQFLAPFTIENFKYYGLLIGGTTYRAAVSTAIRSYVATEQFAVNKVKPALVKTTKKITQDLTQHPELQKAFMKVTAPILTRLQTFKQNVNHAAQLTDEWLGTEYAESPKVKKLNQSTTFQHLIQLQPHPGEPPADFKPAPYIELLRKRKENQNLGYNGVDTPFDLFDVIRPTDDHCETSVADILKVAEIDAQRLLKSYINKLRHKNGSNVSIGLVPETFQDLPPSFFLPRIDPRTGSLIDNFSSILAEGDGSLPEIVLLKHDDPELYKHAGLTQHPQIWLSKKVLEKIPAPDLGDVCALLHKIDPSFKAPVVQRPLAEDEAAALATEGGVSNFFKVFASAFAVGFLGFEAVQIYQELCSVFAAFPDAPRHELLEDYFKAYTMRLQAGFSLAMDGMWQRLTGKHLMDVPDLYKAYRANEPFEQVHAIEQYHEKTKQITDEELNNVLNQIRQQIEREMASQPAGQDSQVMLTPEQLEAIIYAQKFNPPALQTLSLNPADENNAFQTQYHPPDVQLTPEDIEQIEREYPKLREQVAHPFGLAQGDMAEFETYHVKQEPVDYTATQGYQRLKLIEPALNNNNDNINTQEQTTQ